MRAIVVGLLAVLVCGCASEVGTVEPEQRAVDAGQPSPDAGPAAPQEGTPATSDAGVAPDAAPVAPDAAEASADDAGPDQEATAPDAGAASDAGPSAPSPAAGVSLEWDNECTVQMVYGLVRNVGSSPVDVSKITARYWLAPDATAELKFIDPSSPDGKVTLVEMASVGMTPTPHAGRFLEIAFSPSSLPAGAVQGATVNFIYLNVPLKANAVDDWSFRGETDCTVGRYAPWNHVTVYYAGTLVWGVEPTPASDPTP